MSKKEIISKEEILKAWFLFPLGTRGVLRCSLFFVMWILSILKFDFSNAQILCSTYFIFTCSLAMEFVPKFDDILSVAVYEKCDARLVGFLKGATIVFLLILLSIIATTLFYVFPNDSAQQDTQNFGVIQEVLTDEANSTQTSLFQNGVDSTISILKSCYLIAYIVTFIYLFINAIVGALYKTNEDSTPPDEQALINRIFMIMQQRMQQGNIGNIPPYSHDVK